MMEVLKKGSRKYDTEDNWEMYGPTGNHMFTTSKSRVQYYLRKNLAKEIGDKKVQFTIIPNGNGFDDDEIFGKLPRINQCVVCGANTYLQRHHVVPYHYRKFMPLAYKSRNHHDVVLICKHHHEEYERIATTYKNDLAKQYSVGTIAELNTRQVNYIVGHLKNKFKLTKVLDTILSRYNDLPIERIEFLASEIKQIVNLNVLDLSFEKIERLKRRIDLSIEKEKEKLLTIEDFYHGKSVIEQLKTDEEFVAFIKGWRTHFLESMSPQFMPTGWSVDFRCKRGA